MTRLSLTINGRAHGPVEVRDELSMNDFLREYLGTYLVDIDLVYS